MRRQVRQLIILLFLILISNYPLQLAQAQTVQVPENCLNRISPCLIHTEDSAFEFNHDGQQVKLLKEAILKLSFDENSSNFEVIEGLISLNEKKKTQKLLFINNKPVRSGLLMVNRLKNNLRILDLNDYILSEYQVISNNTEPKLIKADFIIKVDFIFFTKFYFQSVPQYRSFLSLHSQNWKNEFNKQNSNQTKVLLRNIASEQKKAKITADINAAQANQQKKARETFFYRTFER